MSQLTNKSETYFYETYDNSLSVHKFIPNLGAVDKIAPQWLAMGL